MPLSVGTTLGRYEIVAPIGAGGMGEVYKAHDPKLGRDVAIKVSIQDFSERFDREARAIATLNHSNICQIYDVGPNYLVMELIEGMPLKGPLPVDQALKYAAQICDALDAAHKKGITHRDLKPANILVTKSGIKLLDFGLAKMASDAKGTASQPSDATLTMALTGKNEIVGTLYYMSPEQLQSQGTDKEIDARSDIFSFGLVLYEMLTGKRAFEGSSPASVIAAIMERPAPSIIDIAPPALDRVLKTCLAKDPDERWQTARDLKRELQWIAEGGSQISSPPVTRLTGIRVWQKLLGAAAIGAIAAATALGFYLYMSRKDPSQTSLGAGVIRLTVPAPNGEDLASAGASDGAVAVSPDGRFLTFTTTSSAHGRRLWVRPLATLDAKLLDNTDGAAWPFWSADSRSIGIFAGGQLKSIDLGNGNVRTICEVPDKSNARGGAWSDQNVIVFAAASAIYRVQAAGGLPVAVTGLKGGTLESRQSFPNFLPDGLHFLYTVQNNRAWGGVYVGAIDGSVSTFVANVESNVVYADGYLLFRGQGARLLAQKFNTQSFKVEGEPFGVLDDFGRSSSEGIHNHFAVSQNGVLAYQPISLPGTKLVWVDRTGKDLGLVAGGGAAYASPVVAPNGQYVAVDRFERPSGLDKIWIFDLRRGSSFPLNPDISSDINPIWSHDSLSLVFAAAADSGWAFYRKEFEARTSPALIQRFDVKLTYPDDVSRDGKLIVFKQASLGGGFRIHLINTSDGKDKPLEIVSSRGRLSPDQRWLAYDSAESGRNEVYVRSLDEKGVVKIASVGGGADPRWRADGRELFYVNGQSLMTVSVQFEPVLKLGSPNLLFRNDAAMWNTPSPTPNGSNYDIAPDGQRILLNLRDPTAPQSPLSVIVNWQAALHK